jgi:hypothetical protein
MFKADNLSFLENFFSTLAFNGFARQISMGLSATLLAW